MAAAQTTNNQDVWHLNDEKRELLSKERLVELLGKRGTEDHSTYSTLRLGGKSFGHEAATTLSDVLSQLANLNTIDLSDIIAGRAEEEALKVLEIITGSLKGKGYVEINLSDNALGLKGRLKLEALRTESST